MLTLTLTLTPTLTLTLRRYLAANRALRSQLEEGEATRQLGAAKLEVLLRPG